MNKCWSFFDFSCYTQYTCITWLVMLVLLLSTLPAGALLLCLLHQKGFFDPVHDWWEDLLGPDDRTHRRHKKGHHHHDGHLHRHGHHPHSHHHAHQRSKSEPSHRHRRRPPAQARHGARRAALAGAGHLGHKRRHGKAVAAAAEQRTPWSSVNVGRRRACRRVLHDPDRHHSWEV